MDRLLPQSTVLVVIDVQERLALAMPNDEMARVVKNATILLETAKLLNVRVLATEQYPKGLGPTVPALADKLKELGVPPIVKMEFGACDNLTFARELAAVPTRAAVVVGMEAHVCVFQTARELVRRGYSTFVVVDAVASRLEENRLRGVSLCERAGAVATCAEAVAFDWLGVARTDAFRGSLTNRARSSAGNFSRRLRAPATSFCAASTTALFQAYSAGEPPPLPSPGAQASGKSRLSAATAARSPFIAAHSLR